MFETLIEYSPIGVSVMSVKTRKRTYFNDMFLELFEIKKEDIASFEPSQTFVNPEDLSRAFDAIPNLGNHATFEMARLRLSGEQWWCRMKIMRMIIDGEESVVTWFEDNTELHNSRQQLLGYVNDLQFVRYALDQHSIISITDVKANIINVNDKFCEISGYLKKELIGKNHRMLLSGEHSKSFFVDMWKTIASGKIWHGEIKNKKKNGEIYWVDTTIVPNLNEQGKPYQYIGIRTDITARKLAEEETLQFKTTLDQTHDSIFMFYPDSMNFFYVNQGAVEQVGYSKKELLNLTAYDLNADLDETMFRKAAQRLIDGPIHFTTNEGRLQCKDGRLVPFEIFFQYVAPVNEEPRFVAIIRDITERKKIEKEKSEFISIVSHELRTPLTAIKGSLGLVQSGAVDIKTDDFKVLLDIAHQNSSRLEHLINDILDMEKFDSGNMVFHMEPMDVISLVENAITENKGYADESGIEFVLCDVEPEALILGDKNRMMQALSNLMSNAVKFSGQGKRVELSIAREGDCFRVSVKDHGLGIPDSFKEHIFNKFTQLDSSDTRQMGGSGLGLNITKEIVEKHKGILGFDTKVGVGTSFFIILPAIS